MFANIARIGLVGDGGDHGQAGEIDERRHDGEDQHESADGEQVSRPEHCPEAFPGAAADDRGSVHRRWSTRRRLRVLPGALAWLERSHPPRGQHGEAQESDRDEDQVRRTDRLHDPPGQPRAEDGADGAAHRDDGEEPLRLLQRETVRHERPEHHGAEQVEDAEPHVEDPAGDFTHGGWREAQERPEDEQAGGEEEIGRSDEPDAAELGDEQTEHRIHGQRDDRRPHEEPPHRVQPAPHPQRFPGRPHDHQRGQHAEEEERRSEEREHLVPADVGEALESGGHGQTDARIAFSVSLGRMAAAARSLSGMK